MLVLIAVFIFFAAKGEMLQSSQTSTRRDNQRGTHSIVDASVDRFFIDDSTQPSLDGDLTADQAARWVANRPGDDFPVRDGNSIIGAITRGDLLKAIVAGGGSLPIKTLMSLRFMNGPPGRYASSH